MKTIQDENRNLTIEEITKIEADTIGLQFFAKESVIPFRDDESVTKYQNLLSGTSSAGYFGIYCKKNYSQWSVCFYGKSDR